MLERFTRKDLIIIDPQIKNKKDLFKLMTKHLAEKGYIENKRYFFKSLIMREKAANTQILPDIAIPHAGCKSVERLFLMIVISKDGIDYEHPKYDKAKIIFLFGCANQHSKEYLRLLAKSARLLKIPAFSENLIKAAAPDEVMRVIAEHDHDKTETQEPKEHYLMLITLFKKHKLPDLLMAMMETGIHNAAVVDSTSLARRIAFEIPIFAGLSMRSKQKSLESAIIISNIPDKKIPYHLAAIMKEHQVDLSEAGTGFIQLFPTKIVIGNIEEFS